MYTVRRKVSKILFTCFFSIVLLLTPTLSWSDDSLLINGAGATFPYPLYAKWFSEYRKVDSSVRINYQSIGSGGGIRQLLDNTVDFGASDAPMKPAELAKAKKSVLHIPTVLGAVAVTYNLPELNQPLNISGSLLADIFLGKVKKWNDKRIQDLNPNVPLPNQHILVVHRSDGSGTTAIFTDFLAKVSALWGQKVGNGKAVRWPTGIGAKGNEGVAGMVKQSPGSIGYLELIYAKTNQLPFAAIQNAEGEFVLPSIQSVSDAADSVVASIPDDFRVSITNPAGKPNAYPIAAFTYLLVYQEMDKTRGGKIVDFLNWAIKPGQSFASELSYAPLPEALVQKISDKVKTIQLQ